jgi:heat shock protein HspQ
MQEEIRKKCDEIRDLLIEKNKSYGNSVFDKGVLFNVDPMYAIQARINDKLNRIKNSNTYLSENDLMDVTGYLILLQVHMDQVDRNIENRFTSNEGNDSEFSYEWNLKNNSKHETGTSI